MKFQKCDYTNCFDILDNSKATGAIWSKYFYNYQMYLFSFILSDTKRFQQTVLSVDTVIYIWWCTQNVILEGLVTINLPSNVCKNTQPEYFLHELKMKENNIIVKPHTMHKLEQSFQPAQMNCYRS